MKRLILGLLFMLVLAGHAIAGQSAPTYYVSNVDWDGFNEASLPHYRSPGQTCVTGILRKIVRGYQVSDPAHLYSYRSVNIGPDDGFSNFVCQGVIEELFAGNWVTVEPVSGDNAAEGLSGPSDPCPLTGLVNSDTSQCGQPKCPTCTAVGNPIDAGTGNKHEVETDYIGAGAFPLRFQRTYDSYRTWYNNSIPIGIGWTHSYLAGIDVVPAPGSTTLTIAYLYRPDGTLLTFTLQGGVWIPDKDVAEKLSITTGVDPNTGITYYLGASLRDKDDTIETFDPVGRLASITNRDGLTQTISYADSSGNLSNEVQKVTDPQGHTLTFGYNANGELASLTDGNGAVIQYGYDSNGNLTTATYPDIGATTKTRTYAYNEAGQVAGSWPHSLTGIIDENNQRYASWGYDLYGRAILSVHGPYTGGTIDKTTLTYNDTNGKTTFTTTVSAALGLSQARTYGYTVKYGVAHAATLDTACDGCAAHDKTDGYDANGYPNASTDFNGNGSTYTFTANTTSGVPGGGLQTQRVEGIPPTGSSDTSAKRIINTTWNPTFRVPATRTVQDASGATPVSVEITKWIYNGRGQPTFRCLVDPTNSTATGYTCGSQTSAPVGVRQWAWTYCDSIGTGCPLIGLLLTSKGPRTDVSELTTYAYYTSTDLSGCATLGGTCHYLGDRQTVKDALGHFTTYVSYDGNGRPTRITEFNGVPTDLSYHPRGWLTQRVVRNLNTGTSVNDRITAYAYDGAGEVTQITQPFGDYQIFGYDLAHRLTDVTNRMSEHLHYVLDDAGDRIEEDRYNSSGTLKRKRLRDYDVLGRLHDVKNAYTTPATLAMTYQYDGNGNVKQATDGRLPSHTTINTYDPRNRVVVVDQDSGETDEAFIHYTYDALDRLTDVQDPFHLHTIYTFDGLGNQSQLSSPDTGLTTYSYDAAGNRTGQVDARPIGAIFGYDALNRMTSITYPATPSLNVGYAWDTNASGCASPNLHPKGRLTQLTDASGSTKFCYDRFGETGLKTQTIAGTAFPVQYTYNLGGQLSSVTEPNGTVVTYVRDNNDRIKIVKYQLSGQATATTLVSAVTYDPFSPANKITYGSGTTARPLSRTYDLDGMIKTVVDSSTVGDGLNLTFSRDAVGNLVQVKTAPTVGNNLFYDGMNRLTEMDASDLSTTPQWRYRYDSSSNRLSVQQGIQPQVDYTYDPINSHHLWDVGTTARQYDLIGNTTQIGSGASESDFHFDDTNRMDQFSLGGVLTKLYLTNALGQRVMKSKTGDSTQTLKTVYDEQGHILGDFNAANAIVDEYLWLDSLPVGAVDGTSGTVKYIEPDHLGTPRAVIDPVSNVAIWSWANLNDPFGQTQPVNLHGSNFALNLRFPGQVYDAESGLNYNNYRYYEAGIGRYDQSDPMGLAAGVNTYGYAEERPMSVFDFFGLSPCCDFARQEILKSPDGGDADGTVACCNGSKVSCVWSEPDSGAPPGTIVHMCKMKHESTHQDQGTCPCPCDQNCLLKVPHEDRKSDECVAYHAQIDCLVSHMRDCGNDSVCRQAITAEIAGSKAVANGKYGCGL